MKHFSLLIFFIFSSCFKETIIVKDYRRSQKDSIKKIILDSVRENSSNSTRIGTARFQRRRINIYDNNRWEFSNTNDLNPVKSQNIKTIISQDQRPPTPSVKYSSNSICGAKTKSGRSCRRRVKNGGFCWQHS